MCNFKSKLALGSANFGLSYGINNKDGKLEKETLAKILSLAEDSGINTIDTAQAYGDSEQRLGSLLRSKFNIITKIGVNLGTNSLNDNIISLVVGSLDRLDTDRLDAVLLHRPELLLGPDGPSIAVELNKLKEMRLAEKIGVSIYSSDILAEASKLLKLDVVQVPFNVFDQRILKTGWNEKLKEKGTEIHTRSTFLQGLLLMKQAEIPWHFSKNWAPLFEQWFDFQRKTGAAADEIALDFALQQPWIDKIVVGVDSALHLDRLLKIEANKRFSSLPSFDIDDIDLIDPSCWKIR